MGMMKVVQEGSRRRSHSCPKKESQGGIHIERPQGAKEKCYGARCFISATEIGSSLSHFLATFGRASVLFIGEEAEEPAHFFMGQERHFFGHLGGGDTGSEWRGCHLPDVGVVTTTERGLDQVVFLQQVMSHVNIPAFVIIPCP